ncbi:MAG TPA: carboxyl transferase domain-containing protein [Usitatibacter sp.]|nr:carboxyl transferase domain-containing protein [Usitatibacter sp.]
MTAQTLLEALRAAVAFEPAAERVGNLTLGHGTLDGREVHVALIENFIASGSLGAAEDERLVAMFERTARDRAPLVLYIDSAGARVSEGLRALGGFRTLYRAGLAAALSGAPIAALLGRNCYGGASMLAHLARERLFGRETQLAMSGPAVIAASSGVDALDPAFRAMAQATFAQPSRGKATPANAAWKVGDDVAAWLRKALARGDDAASFRERHARLRERFEAAAPEPAWKAAKRPELDRIYTQHEARLCDGVIEGHGERDGVREAFAGCVDNLPVSSARAWRFADIVWHHLDKPPPRLQVYLDSASHAARLDEEKRILSEYIVDMAAALAALEARGTQVGLTITGRAGGGVYVALAAPARRVAAVHGMARIEVLPGMAVAAILGESRDDTPSFSDYRTAGVAEDELRLGIVPPSP